MRAGRLLRGLLVAALAAAPLAILPALPAAADEVYGRPSDGVFKFEGHGWGHGHGLSQWGAEGAARTGVSATTILDAYYPGTGTATQAPRTIRVLIGEDDHTDLHVRAVSGLQVRDLATGATYTLPSGPTRWRIVADSAGMHVQSYSGSWAKWTSSTAKSSWTGPMEFRGVTPIRVYFTDGSAREYRGTMRAVRTGTASINVVNVLSMEQYLYGVVPRESPASWHAEALKAQAVAARSYSTYKLDHVSSGSTYDICSTTSCQVYGGVRLITSGGSVIELENASTNSAVNATAGVVRTYGGQAIFAEFSSSNGGWSTQGSMPYLAPHADPWDAIASPMHYWTATLTASQIEARYPSVGHLLRIRVTRRDGNGEWGGRVKDVVLEGVSSSGAATSVSTTGGGIYSVKTWPASSTGLRGTWWHVIPQYGSTVLGRTANPTVVRPPGTAKVDVAVRIENTGSTGWPVSGLHLAVASPAGAADPMVGDSTKPGRYDGNLTTPGSTTVNPGETARFVVPLDVSGFAAGTYPKSYRVRIGSGAVFGATVSWLVTVVDPTYTSSVVSVTGAPPSDPAAPPTVWSDGTVVVPRYGATTVNVRVKNTSNVPWPLNGKVLLATSGARGRESWSAGAEWVSKAVVGPVTSVEGATGATAVKPGQTGVFPMTLHGNAHGVGVTTETFEAKYSPYAWLAGSSVTLRIVRADYRLDRVAQVVSATPAQQLLAYPGDRTTLVLRVRNLGGSVWHVGGGDVAATASPAGRVDALRTSAWASSTRATLLAANKSRPGATGVYPGEIGEYRVPIDPTNKTPATYGELFQPMVASTGLRYGPVLGTQVTVSAATLTATLTRNTSGITVPVGGLGTYSIDLKNTGNTTWQVGGYVRVWAPSTSHTSTWLATTRPTAVTRNISRPGATTIRPGEVARFIFTIGANGRAKGAYTETFGAGWDNWRSTGLKIPITYVIK
jgi:SpoIID/LytB domain protein